MRPCIFKCSIFRRELNYLSIMFLFTEMKVAFPATARAVSLHDKWLGVCRKRCILHTNQPLLWQMCGAWGLESTLNFSRENLKWGRIILVFFFEKAVHSLCFCIVFFFFFNYMDCSLKKQNKNRALISDSLIPAFHNWSKNYITYTHFSFLSLKVSNV